MTNKNNPLETAKKDATDYSLSGAPCAFYQVGVDKFITTCTPLETGTVVGVWMNGVQDGRYASLFNR